MAQSGRDVEAFPTVDANHTHDTTTTTTTTHPDDPPYQQRRSGSRASSVSGVVRKLSREFSHSRVPEGFMAATGDIASTMATPNYTHASLSSSDDTAAAAVAPASSSNPIKQRSDTAASVRRHTESFDNGYHFPPSYPWQETTKHGLAAFWKFVKTPMGAFWTFYGLNVVAWGGMLFLLLCNAAPAMCYPTCDDIDSPRRKWVEWDSQILTGLFCVTAFGLAPWRFRDLWFLMQYRLRGRQDGLRRLAAIHRSWFRLAGTEALAPEIGKDNVPDHVDRGLVPLPEKDMPPAPLTGVRAPATPVWKMDFVIWTMVWNSLGQVGLCGIMWGMNRYDRPSWSTGFLVGVTCVIAMVGGWVMFREGKKVKSIEGVPLSERDLERLARDKEQGISHYNNIKDKKPKKEKEQDPEKASQ